MASAKNEAKIKFTAETHEFNLAIQEATSSMKELRVALALNATEMKNGGDQTENLLNRYKMLSKQYEEAGRIVDNLYEKLKVAERIYGESSTQVSEYSAKLFQAENAQLKLGQQINECVAEINKMVNSTGDGQSAYAKMTTTIAEQEKELQELKQQYVEASLAMGEDSAEAKALATQIVTLSWNLSENKQTLQSASESADAYDQNLNHVKETTVDASEAIDRMKGYFDSLDQSVTHLVQNGFREIVSATREVGEYAVKTGMTTEASFAKVNAVMQATEEDMRTLKGAALEVQQGISPLPYTLNDCATAYYYMGLAGWDATASAKALYPTLSLVKASGEELADVSDIVTDNITAFGLSANDTQYMVDVLAQTMRSTNTDVGLLGETFKYAAAPAHAAGYVLEDVALAAGLMANNGIKGSQAGTSLRQMFVQLAKPTEDSVAAMDKLGISLTDDSGKMLSLKELLDKTRVAFAGFSVNLYDAEGNLREYDDILQEVEATNQDYVAAEKLKAAAQIYGTRAMSGVLSIVNMSEEEYRRVTNEIYNYNGACEEMASIMSDTLEGDVGMLNASLNTLANNVYDQASPALRTFVQTLTDWVNSDQSVKLINQISTELTGLLNGVLWDMPNIISNISTILQGVPSVISGVSSAIQFVTGNIDTIVTAIKAALAVWGAIQALKVSTKIAEVGLTVVGLVAKVVSMTGATQAATVAQWAFNAAQTATPWGLAVAGAAALVTGIVALVKWVGSLNDNTEQCNQRIQTVVANITPFRDGMAGLASTFQLTSQQMSNLTDLDDQIAQAEENATTAMANAMAAHGVLRDNEIQQYEQYTQHIAELEAQKLAIYREGVTNIGYEIQASIQSVNGMTQTEMQQYLVNLQSALKSSNEAVNASCQTELDRINEYYKARGESGSQAHLAEIEAAKAHAEQEKATNQQMYSDNLATLANYAAQMVSGDQEMWMQVYANSNKGREQYTANLEQMDLDAAEAFLSMWSSAKKAGADIPVETDQLALNILNSFKNLPSKLEEQGREVLGGLITGMENDIPKLQQASEATCDEIVDTITGELEIHSPSRVMIDVGGNTVQGLVDGMMGKQSTLNATASAISKDAVKALTPEPRVVSGIGQNAISGVDGGLRSKTSALNSTAQMISRNTVKALTPRQNDVTSIGSNLISGIDSGMQQKSSWPGSRIASFASGLVDKFKSAFRIGSPSKIMAEEVGEWLPAGIGAGIENNASAAIQPLRTLVNSMTAQKAGLSGSLGGFSVDVNNRIQDHMLDAFDNNAQFSIMERVADAVDRLANLEFVINMNISDRRIAQATASASDSVSGSRIGLRERGLALE